MTEKKRYLLLKLEHEAVMRFGSSEAKHCVYEALFSVLGEAGAARAQAQIKHFDEAKQLLVLKCATSELDNVIAALAAKTEFKGSYVALRLQRISGLASKLISSSS